MSSSHPGNLFPEMIRLVWDLHVYFRTREDFLNLYMGAFPREPKIQTFFILWSMELKEEKQQQQKKKKT